jgi:DNA replication protein DnaC
MKDEQLNAYLLYLKLSFFREYHPKLAKEAAEKNWSPLDFLTRLVEGEALRRKDRATKRRIQAARFPIIKTLEQFNWTWPKKINRAQVQNLFRLSFAKEKGNVIFMGGVGLGIMPIMPGAAGSAKHTWPLPWLMKAAWRGTRLCTPRPLIS